MFKFLGLIGIVLVVWIPPINAKTTVEFVHAKRAVLKSVQSRILSLDQGIEHLQNQHQDLQLQLAELEKKIGTHAAQLRSVEHKIDQRRLSMATTHRDTRALMMEVESQKKNLKNQFLAAYHIDRQSRLKLMLNNQSAALSDRLLNYYHFLNKARLEKVIQLEANTKQLLVLDTKQKEEIGLLDRDLSNKQAEQSQLIEVKQARTVLLQQLHTQLSHDNKLLHRLKSNEKALKLLLSGLQQAERPVLPAEEEQASQEPKDMASDTDVAPDIDSQSVDQEDKNQNSSENSAIINQSHADFSASDDGKEFGQLKGQLMWPVAGRIINDANDAGHGGVLIEATEGSSVRSIASGRVVYAGWMKGYGLLAIVDHGGGYMTIYAFNQSLYKHVGSKLNAGDVIASVGQSGGRSNAALYFEIRKHGQPLRPDVWCKK